MNKLIKSWVILVLLSLAGCHKKNTVKYTEKSVTSSLVNKPIKTLDVKQLHTLFLHYKKNNDYQKQIACLERIILICNDNQETERCSLWLADIFAQQADNDKAYKQYIHYGTLYPGSAHAAYAHMRSIDTLFATTLAVDRDQSATRSTLQAIELYLLKCKEHNKSYQKYEQYVLSIAQQCAQKLIDHEISVINFYSHQGNGTAATARLEAVSQELHHLCLLVPQAYNQRIQALETTLLSSNSKLNVG